MPWSDSNVYWFFRINFEAKWLELVREDHAVREVSLIMELCVYHLNARYYLLSLFDKTHVSLTQCKIKTPKMNPH